MNSRIILLNGVGSVGKTSIAQTLQSVVTEPFLHLQMDTFLDMLPQAYHDHPDGFTYESVRNEGNPSVVIKTGPIGARTLRGMRHAIAAMAEQGNNIIDDDVVLASERAEYDELLSNFEFHVVGVFASLTVLEAREKQRGDRMIGLARWQYGRIHKDMIYDLEVDTDNATPMECALRIKERFGL